MDAKPHTYTIGTHVENPKNEEKITHSREEILELITKCQEIFKNEETLLELSGPMKVFGDIHGHFETLQRFFYNYKMPSEDIGSTGYLFLGNYGNRAN
jgi:hypothetical protein